MGVCMSTPIKLNKTLNYPAGRRSKHNPNGLPPKYLDKELLARFVKLHGEPNVTRNKRALVKEFNPLHYTFGEVRPVWKTWHTYAWNMGLLEDE
jgi:hypothetical protein